MTDSAPGVPSQRSDDVTPASTAPPEDISPATAAAPAGSGPEDSMPAGSGSTGSTSVPDTPAPTESAPVDLGPAETSAVDSPTGLDRTVGAAERLGERATGAAERVGERAVEVAGRVGERAGEVAAQVGERAGEVAAQVGDAVERAAQASGRVAAAVVDRLRNNAELAAERGTTTIANEVVEKIAGIAAREVPGVYELGGDVARVFAAVKERIGLGEADDDNRGIRVRLDGRAASINITLVIEFGFVVHSVTEKVRAKVISSVENLLGLEVTEVNIVVDDVHFDQTRAHGDDEARAGSYQ